MDFTITQRIDAPLDRVQAALVDPAFIAACADLPRLGDSTLLDEDRSADRVRLRVRRRFTGELNRAVTKVIDPGKLTWVEDIVFDLSAHRAQHRVVPDNYPDRLSSAYTTTLTEQNGSTTRVARGTMSVRAPLVGGRIEQAIVSGLEEYAHAEAVLLGKWAS